MSLATLVWFLEGAETICSPLAILRGTEHVSALTHALYIAALSLLFSLLDFVRFCADRVLTLNIKISDFHCFGALGVRPGSLTLPHVQAWRIGVITAIVEPQSKCHKRCLAWLAIVFPWNLEFFWKQWPAVRVFSNLVPQTAKCNSNLIILIWLQVTEASLQSNFKFSSQRWSENWRYTASFHACICSDHHKTLYCKTDKFSYILLGSERILQIITVIALNLG